MRTARILAAAFAAAKLRPAATDYLPRALPAGQRYVLGRGTYVNPVRQAGPQPGEKHGDYIRRRREALLNA